MDSKILSQVTAMNGMPSSSQATRPVDSAKGSRDVQQGKELPKVGESLPHAKDEKEVSSAQINSAVDSLRDYVQTIQRELEFTVDEDTGQQIIKVIDSETDKVIRQIPPEELLAIARHLNEANGVMLEVEA